MTILDHLAAAWTVLATWIIGYEIYRYTVRRRPTARLVERAGHTALDAPPAARRAVDLSPVDTGLAHLSAHLRTLAQENDALRGTSPSWSILDGTRTLRVPAHRVGPAIVTLLGLGAHVCGPRPDGPCRVCYDRVRADVIGRAALVGAPLTDHDTAWASRHGLTLTPPTTAEATR